MRRLLALMPAFILAGCSMQAPPVATLACASSATESEALAGATAARSFEPQFGGVERDRRAETRMVRTAERLTRANTELRGSYEFRLLSTDRRNAASLPVGRIYITRGLYDVLPDDELAAVIAHEIAHLEARDSFQPRCASLAEALEREKAADARAVSILLRAGISGDAMARVVELIVSIQPAEWVQTRVRAIEEVAGD